MKAHKWVAQIRNGDRIEYLGAFMKEIDAAKAYDVVARLLDKKKINFPNEIRGPQPEHPDTHQS